MSLNSEKMGNLMYFNPDANRLVDTVTISAENGLDGIVNAVKSLSLNDGGIMEGKLKSKELDPNEDIHQIFIPDPVIRYALQPDGSYIVQVLEGSFDGPVPPVDAPPKRNSTLLLSYLQLYSENESKEEEQ